MTHTGPHTVQIYRLPNMFPKNKMGLQVKNGLLGINIPNIYQQNHLSHQVAPHGASSPPQHMTATQTYGWQNMDEIHAEC